MQNRQMKSTIVCYLNTNNEADYEWLLLYSSAMSLILRGAVHPQEERKLLP